MHKKGHVLWFTGLSGAGKSTLATALGRYVIHYCPVRILDGDILRQTLCKDLGFSANDRTENIRRTGLYAHQLSNEGQMVICALITPTEKDRLLAKTIIGSDYFHQIYIKADIKTCTARDPKGLYKKALQGQIKEFTGISAPFEKPAHSSLTIDTRHQSVEHSLKELIDYITALL
jgi:adenylyl-sulfate kinase